MKYPESLAIYLDSGCNLQCSFCLYKDRPGRPGKFDVRCLHALAVPISKAKTVVLSAWGEPLPSPHLPDVLDYIYAHNPRTNLIGIVTNGVNLSAKTYRMLYGHLAELVISINAGTRATYERDMAGSWDTLMASVRAFIAAMDPSDRAAKIGIHMVAHAGNYREMAELVAVAHALGVTRVRVDQMMAAQLSQLNLTLTNVKKEYEREVDRAINMADQCGVSFQARRFGVERGQRCTSLTDECHVWADGRMSPCCYNGSYFLGNAYQSGFDSVWFGERIQNTRRDKIPQCKTCPKVLPFDHPAAHIYPLLLEEMRK